MPKTYNSAAWTAAQQRALQGKLPKFMVEETAFDRMLREAGIHPDKAAEFLMVRQWVKRNYQHRYVPEKVLEACGITVHQAAGR